MIKIPRIYTQTEVVDNRDQVYTDKYLQLQYGHMMKFLEQFYYKDKYLH